MAEGSGAIRAGEAFVEITGESGGLEHELKEAENSLRGWGVRLAAIGAAISAVGFGIAKVFERAAEAAGEEQAAEAQIAAAIKSTGGAAGYNAEQLKKMAEGFSDVSTASDKTLLEAESLLLMFDKISGEQFPRTIQASLDLASALKMDLGSAIRIVGRALQDPLTGMLLLRKARIDFSKSDQELIKTLTESGHLLEAQNVIFARLAVKTGGRAAAELNTYSGRMKSLHNAIEEVYESIGGALLPALTSFAVKAKEITDRVKEFVDTHQPLIQGIAKISAELIAMGAVLAGIGAAFLFITHPALLSILAISGAIVSLLDSFGLVKTGMDDLSGQFAELGADIGGTFGHAIETVAEKSQAFFDDFHANIQLLINDIARLGDWIGQKLGVAFNYWKRLLGISDEKQFQGQSGKINTNAEKNSAKFDEREKEIRSEFEDLKKKRANEIGYRRSPIRGANLLGIGPGILNEFFRQVTRAAGSVVPGNIIPLKTAYQGIMGGQNIGEHLGFGIGNMKDLQSEANSYLKTIADNTDPSNASAAMYAE